ncbi:hypothetical protein [Tepidiforma sp.]|uniref:hypothetical protein n=1 Tax=Tepidiforma sp. TaxID=2682230 RepID=UPI002ADE3CDF|nr:hypothetical protein [Tepidiforma sp.]
MAWIIRWWRALLDRVLHRGGDDAWVEPWNAITRAVLGQAPAPVLPPVAPTAVVRRERRTASVIAIQSRQQPVTRTAQRVRRRRAARAA